MHAKRYININAGWICLPFLSLFLLLIINGLFIECDQLPIDPPDPPDTTGTGGGSGGGGSTTPPNYSPRIISLKAGKTNLKPNETTYIVVNAYDSNKDPLNYVWSVSAGRIMSGAGTDSIMFRAPSDIAGSITVSVTASDGQLSASRDLILTIAQNFAPVVTQLVPESWEVNPGDTVIINADVEDENLQTLTYNWDALHGQFLPPANSASVSYIAPVTGGDMKISLTVTDDQGLTGKDSLQLTIQSHLPPDVQITYPPVNAYYIQHDTAHVRIHATHENGISSVSLYINGSLKETKSGSRVSDNYLFTPKITESGGTAYLVAYATAQTAGSVGVDSVAVTVEGVILGKKK